MTSRTKPLGLARIKGGLENKDSQTQIMKMRLGSEMFMLAVMAYDRFVAVCNPLLYTVAMSHKRCAFLVAGTYMWGGLCSVTLTYSLPHDKSSWLLVKVESALNMVMIPMLNPLIYSLKNKDVKETVRRLIHAKLYSLYLKFR
ncbi:Olfactory receptor 5D13 [Sciurus carolinensis]|uniref:Olfactory receptor 5D13 n=1 Tax=Sciurus carolinensis TaxID=30640 RepID=A0AA41NAT3_SCICA|nr:Olfactory receptor 5D13 [Sciurus carolinensis]